jgi:predicted dehydrogenase
MNDPSTPVRWGIIGTSEVSTQFCTELKKLSNVSLHHVCSRSEGSVREFSDRFSIPQSSTSLDQFLADPELDIIYVASPTALHVDHVTQCLDAGRAVLCEKPFTTNLASAERLFDLARGKKIFCMEGLWMRFNPLVQRAKKLIQDGAIGELKSMRAEIGYLKNDNRADDCHRGAVWDFGVYGLSLFHFIAGPPVSVRCLPNASSNDDLSSGFAAVLNWQNHTATLSARIDAEQPNEAAFVGTNGILKHSTPFIGCPRLVSSIPLFAGSPVSGRLDRTIHALTNRSYFSDPLTLTADPQSGFYHQAVEATERFLTNELESPIVPWQATLDVIATAEKLQIR